MQAFSLSFCGFPKSPEMLHLQGFSPCGILPSDKYKKHINRVRVSDLTLKSPQKARATSPPEHVIQQQCNRGLQWFYVSFEVAIASRLIEFNHSISMCQV
jgi:hypothetical protein